MIVNNYICLCRKWIWENVRLQTAAQFNFTWSYFESIWKSIKIIHSLLVKLVAGSLNPIFSYVAGMIVHLYSMKRTDPASSLDWSTSGLPSLWSKSSSWLQVMVMIPPYFFFPFQMNCTASQTLSWLAVFEQMSTVMQHRGRKYLKISTRVSLRKETIFSIFC